MRKLTKKIIVAVLSLAMVMGVMAIPTFAAPTATTEVVIVLPDGTNANKVYLQPNGNNSELTVTCTNTQANPIGWGNLYVPTKNGNEYTFTFTGSFGVSDYFNLNIVICEDTNPIGGYAYYPQNNKSMFNDNAKIWIKVDTVNNGISAWPELVATNTDPSALSDSEIAAAAEDKMDEAISLEANLDNKAKYVDAKGAYDVLTAAQKALVDATKYSKITAALATIADIEANAAGDLTIYVITESWTDTALYGWYGDNSKLAGAWPGKVLSADENNTTYKVFKGTLTGPVKIIFNNNDNSNQQKTNEKYFIKGTYWVSIDGNNGLNVSTTKPSNWVEDTEVPTTTAANETTTAANETTTAADNKATTAADNKATTAANETTTAADNGGAGAGEAESTTGAGGSSTDVGASDSSVVIFAVLAVVAIMGAAMVFVKKKSQEA